LDTETYGEWLDIDLGLGISEDIEREKIQSIHRKIETGRVREREKEGLRDLLRYPLPVAQQGDKVLAVTAQQVIRHLLANEVLRSLNYVIDRQWSVVVVVFVVDPVRVVSNHFL
jgi:hypothetical protein